jgi:uncharacterized membrane protein YqjE
MTDHNAPNGNRPGIGDLLRRLGDDASALVRNEIGLAKLEMRQAVQALMRDSAKLGVALTLACIGALALTAALVIGLAHLLGERYGFAALIVGVVFLVVGAMLARGGVKGLGGGALKPAATMTTLAESRDWAADELRQLKRELTADREPDATLPPAASRNVERTQVK